MCDLLVVEREREAWSKGVPTSWLYILKYNNCIKKILINIVIIFLALLNRRGKNGKYQTKKIKKKKK